jgi:hypothetical protein
VPAASRWPFEVQLAPHRKVPDIPALTDEERDAFGPLYLDVLRRFDALFGKPMPYISAWHQAVVGEGRELGYLHLQLFSIRRAADKLKYLAGSSPRWAPSSTTSSREGRRDPARSVRSQLLSGSLPRGSELWDSPGPTCSSRPTRTRAPTAASSGSGTR